MPGRQVAVVGLGHSKVYRRAEVPLAALAIEASKSAIADAGLLPSDVDGISGAPDPTFGGAGSVDGIDLVTPEFVTRALGLQLAWGEGTPPELGVSFINAARAVATGACDTALVVRAMHAPTGRYGHVDVSDARGWAQYSAPYGASGGNDAYAALMQRYMDKYGATREQMGKFICRNRETALMYEHGFWYQHRPEPLTLDEYMNARLISGPMCLYDCDLPVQGAAAFVLTTAERARDLPHPPAYILAMGAAFDITRPAGTWLPLEEQVAATKRVADRVYSKTGLTPKDVDVANLYDGYSIFTPLQAEAFGLCDEGDGFAFIASPEIPLNTSSGSLGAGRLHGIPQYSDAVAQVMGRSARRQVKDVKISLAAFGIVTKTQAVIFGTQPLS